MATILLIKYRNKTNRTGATHCSAVRPPQPTAVWESSPGQHVLSLYNFKTSLNFKKFINICDANSK